ncbi:hypothetical protein I6N90_08425 [Paenibacillus sp. GSMTC-2017]|uniref:hypothetical protein n=1 Tax=Paenibacillus sp. GSMTC-2017 TaxID=2794350 RepID=UPI0018D87555|nr:hypothetical protein [Paenibacillus sp. GSMTC-2017]MBH5317828.1 hypothetical protein [Paenibacillus sp. GSMTC-2017]
MRINNYNPIFIQKGKGNNLSTNKELFQSTLFEQTIGKKKDEETNDKSVEKKGKLITAKEGAYVRQYLINSDGSKVLLNETKQAADEGISTENYSRSLSKQTITQNDTDGMNENTKETIQLLKHFLSSSQ